MRIIEKPSQDVTEPITLDEAKKHCKVDGNEDDTLLERILIPAVRDLTERYIRRSCAERSWLGFGDVFPSSTLAGIQSLGVGYVIPAGSAALYQRAGTIEIPWGPLKASSGITSIKYLDTNGAQQTLSASKYVVDPYEIFPRIEPAYGECWPLTRDQVNAIEIEFIAGFNPLPPGLRAGMLIWLGTLYEHRQDIVAGSPLQEMPMPASSRVLLGNYRVPPV